MWLLRIKDTSIAIVHLNTRTLLEINMEFCSETIQIRKFKSKNKNYIYKTIAKTIILNEKKKKTF